MRSFSRNTLTIFIICAFLSASFAPLGAEAQFGGVQGSGEQDIEDSFTNGVVACAATAAALYLLSSIPGLSVPTADTPNTVKEVILDCVFWAFKNAIIQEVTGETVQWIQTGFGGNPAFVRNINQYLGSLADQVAGSYIQDVAPFLCSPFRAEVQLQLTRLYQNQRNQGRYGGYPTCTLTDAISNVDRFLDGDFSAGGWDGWFSLVTNPYNNKYGAYLEASDQLASRISSATGEAEKKLGFGQGFLSKEVQQCYEYPPEGQEGPPRPIDPDFVGPVQGRIVCDEPQVITPGTQVRNSLQQALGVNLDQIASADEFDEFFSLVAAYIISDILTGDDGLAGYDPSTIDHELPDVTIPGGGGSTGDSEPPGPPGPSMCFSSNGTFIAPERGGPEFGQARFPVPQNVSYDQIVFQVDVTNNGWRSLDEQPVPPNSRRAWVYNIFYLPRNDDVFGYVNVRGPDGPSTYTNKVILQHGVGQPWSLKPTDQTRMTFPVGATYRFTYTYDASNDTIDLVVRDRNTNDVAARISMVPDAEINTGDERFSADISFPIESGNVYDTPSYGWEYSNLKVQFLTNGDTPGSCSSVPVQPITGSGGGAVGGNDDGGSGGGGGSPGGGGIFNPPINP